MVASVLVPTNQSIHLVTYSGQALTSDEDNDQTQPSKFKEEAIELPDTELNVQLLPRQNPTETPMLKFTKPSN
jgi:hypothetical protein